MLPKIRAMSPCGEKGHRKTPAPRHENIFDRKDRKVYNDIDKVTACQMKQKSKTVL